MTEALQHLLKHLEQRYLPTPKGEGALTAAELGQQLALAGVSLEEMATLHAEALEILLTECPECHLRDVAPWLSTLFSELLTAYHMTLTRSYFQQSWQQTQHALEVQNTQLRSLYRLGRSINATFEIDTIFMLLTQEAMLATGATHAAVLLVDHAENCLQIKTLLGFSPEETAFALNTRLVLGKGLNGYAYEHQCVVVVDDVREDPRYWEFVPSTRAELVLPILHEGTVLGNLDLQSPVVGAFRHVDLEYLKALADQAAIAIRNAQLYQQARLELAERRRIQEALERRARQLSLVWQVSQQMTSLLEPGPLLERIAELIRMTFNYAYVVILLVDTTGTRLSIKAKAGFELHPARVIELEVGKQGICGWVAAHGKPLVVNDVSTEPRYWKLEELSRTRSEIAVPIKTKGQILGVLDVQSAELNAFNADDLFILEVLADQIGVTVENARLLEAEQQRRREAETLRTAALSMITTVNRDQVIEQILIELRKVVPYDSASVQLLKGQHLEIIGGHGFPNLEELLGLTFDLTLNNSPNCVVMRTRRTYIVQDAPSVYREFLNEPHAPANIHSWLGVPLLIGNEPIGMLALDKHDIGFYTMEHARLAEAFAAQAAIAVANSQLFEAEREQRELAEALAQAAAAITSTLDHNEVLDRILEQIQRIVSGDACNIMLVEGDYARPVRSRGYEKILTSRAAKQIPMPISSTPTLKRMLETGEPVVVTDTLQDVRWIPPENNQVVWLRSYVGAPVRMGGTTLGFLNVDSSTPNRFGADDARRLALFAPYAATAIENARLYRELQDYAGTLERRVQERTTQIQAQLARLDAILNSASDGIIVADARGEILEANPVAQDLLAHILPPDNAAELRAAIRNLVLGTEKTPQIFLNLAGIDLQLQAAPILEPASSQPSIVVTLHDISQIKALERMKASFVANVSQELRTPVTTVKLYAELLLKQPEKVSQYVPSLLCAVEHLAQLVEKILQLAHIDAGRMELRLESVRLEELVELVINNHQTTAREAGLSLRYHPVRQELTIRGDPRQLVTVLGHVIENALLYTLPGGEVTVTTEIVETAQRRWAMVQVQDNGVGIPEEELPHIFERFFRGKIPQLMQRSGTGLGLAIVKEIVEMHGGWTTVESQVKRGSTFRLYLPLLKT